MIECEDEIFAVSAILVHSQTNKLRRMFLGGVTNIYHNDKDNNIIINFSSTNSLLENVFFLKSIIRRPGPGPPTQAHPPLHLTYIASVSKVEGNNSRLL